MKKILFAILMCWSFHSSYAYTDVHDVAYSSATIFMFNVSSFTYTALDNTSAYLLPGRYKVELYNASTDTINCSFNPGVSIISTNELYGKPILKLESWIVNVSDNIKIYCKTPAVNQTSRLMMIQYK